MTMTMIRTTMTGTGFNDDDKDWMQASSVRCRDSPACFSHPAPAANHHHDGHGGHDGHDGHGGHGGHDGHY